MGQPEPTLRFAMESIQGRRPYQEDAGVAETLADGRTLVAVADGMGGHAAGDVASALAMETLLSSLEEGRSLDQAVRAANARVHQEGGEPGKEGMGTTLVALLLEGNRFQVANVGDSRAYLLSREKITQITEDHSFVAEAVRNGGRREDALASRWRDALTRSIGTAPDVDVDIFGPFAVKPETALLLCSDGLYKALSDRDVHAVFTSSEDPRDACASLVSEAYDRGSDDNITAAAVAFRTTSRDEVRSGGSPSVGNRGSSPRRDGQASDHLQGGDLQDDGPRGHEQHAWGPLDVEGPRSDQPPRKVGSRRTPEGFPRIAYKGEKAESGGWLKWPFGMDWWPFGRK